ncbi:MAG: VOC family protein [Streptosporangiales bacterium]|nr:VOC family protein [Streptosporangiales bacterium]
MTTLTPYLTVDDAASAIAFYGKAFGAVERTRHPMDDGRLGHAELLVDGAALMLSDEYPEVGARSPRSLGGATSAIVLTVDDVDAVYTRAVDAGATADRPPSDAGYGRRGWLVDPYGHRWCLSSPAS